MPTPDLFNLDKLNQKDLKKLLRTLDNYSSVPVDIDTFLDDPYYLGQYFGEKGIQPYWRDVLKKIFSNPFDSEYWLICLRGSIGQGKTTIACVGITYDIHRLLCVTSPQASFSLLPDTTILFAIFNITLSLASDVVWSTMSSMFARSPYFQDIVKKLPKGKMQSQPMFPKNIGLFIGSRLGHTLGKAVYSCLIDEANFEIIHGQVYESFLSIIRRMESRFSANAPVGTGKVWLVSSENSKSSTLNKIINSYKGKTGVMISQASLWRVYPERYGSDRFLVFTGVDTRGPEIIGVENEDLHDLYPDKIIKVPTEHRNAFEADIFAALMDLAGVEVGGGQRLFKLKDKLNIMMTGPALFPDIITLDFDGPDQLQDYSTFLLNEKFSTSPRSLHIDLALSGDRLGIAAAHISEYVVKETMDNIHLVSVKESKPKVIVDFAFSVAAQRGKQIPLYKIRSFITWLTKIGFPIYMVTSDSFQSADLLQHLKRQGYKTAVLSLDKTADGYIGLRNIVYEGDCTLPKSALLKRELEELEFMNKKVDHPIVFNDGTPGSKDIADSVAGAVFNCISESDNLRAIKATEEFADKWEQMEAENQQEDFKETIWPLYKRYKDERKDL